MKLKLALLFLSLTGTAMAYEQPMNPDRFISLSLNVTGGKMDGSTIEKDGPSPALTRSYTGNTDVRYRGFGGGIRLPLSSSVTADVSAAFVNSEASFTREGNIYNQSSDLDGYEYKMEMRWYLNK